MSNNTLKLLVLSFFGRNSLFNENLNDLRRFSRDTKKSAETRLNSYEKRILCMNFTSFILKQSYQKIADLGDRLGEIERLIDWSQFVPIILELYSDNLIDGGRPHIDEILLIKILVLQQWYGLSDYEIEKQANDRVSFQNFLGFPNTIHDRSTVWRFRERLIKHNKEEAIWTELLRQIDLLGFHIKRGVIQDVSFITSDPSHARIDKPRGEAAKTRRSEDGTWVKKGKKSNFGFKLHTIVDK